MTAMTGREETDSHLIDAGASLKDALVKLNALSGKVMTLVVILSDGRVGGTLTDGDIRRALIAGAALDDCVVCAMHRGFMALRPSDDAYLRVSEAVERGLALLPELDSEGRLAGLLDLRKRRAMLPVEAVLMAGGKGERLRPLTLECPKPLLKVGGKAVIDYNVEALRRVGIRRICVTVNYLQEQIIAHFTDFGSADEKVECVSEPCRLGTMGSLALCAPFSEPDVLVMNSDLLTDMDFEELYRHHRASGADLTMAVVPYPVSVPFAIIEKEGDRVTGLEEKPTYNNLANAGVYLMRREIAENIAPGRFLDAPDLIEQLIAEGRKVSWYKIRGTWIDIGSPDDYRYANEILSHNFNR